MKTVTKLTAKSYLLWLGVALMQLVLILYLAYKLRIQASEITQAVDFLQMGLFCNSNAVPVGCISIYGLLWLEEFNRRRLERLLSAGIRRQDIFWSKALFSFVWLATTVFLFVVILWLIGVDTCGMVVTGEQWRTIVPMLLVYIGMIFFLSGLCTFCGVFFKKNSVGLVPFGIFLFFWEQWQIPLGTERIYSIAFYESWKKAGILLGIFLVLSVLLHLGAYQRNEKMDYR